MLLSFVSFAKCPDILKSYGPDWIQGFVEVPLDWNNPNSELIKVAYYHKRQDLFEEKTPTVFFNGGPTMAGHSSINILSNKSSKLKDENMIYIDQRGTGCSSLFPQYHPENQDVYKYYTSESIVRDAEVIREKLFGDRKWNIFGQSYGGLISFRYIETYPESIASAHIHGYGINDDALAFFESRENAIAKFTDEILNYKNPKISQFSVEQLMGILKSNPDFGSICFDVPRALKSKFCGPDIFTSLFMITGFKNSWSQVLSYMQKFYENLENPHLLKKEMERFVNIYILRFNNTAQAAALNTISFIEMAPGRLFYDNCTKENPIISECRFKKNFLPRLDNRPEVATSPLNKVKIKNNIQAHNLDIKYYAGRYDTFIPEQLIVDTAKELGITQRLHVFEKSGHEGFYTEALVFDQLKISGQKNLSCSSALKNFFF